MLGRRKSVFGAAKSPSKALLALDMFPKVEATLSKTRATAGAGLLLLCNEKKKISEKRR